MYHTQLRDGVSLEVDYSSRTIRHPLRGWLDHYANNFIPREEPGGIGCRARGVPISRVGGSVHPLLETLTAL